MNADVNGLLIEQDDQFTNELICFLCDEEEDEDGFECYDREEAESIAMEEAY